MLTRLFVGLALVVALVTPDAAQVKLKVRVPGVGIEAPPAGNDDEEDPDNPNLLTGAEITSNYLGGFRMPNTASNGHYMDAAPAAIAYNPNSGGLFAVTRVFGGADGELQKVAELNIPTLVNTSSVGSMNRATYLQGITEPMEAANVPNTLALMDYCTLAQRQGGSCQPASLIALAVEGSTLVFSYGIGYDSDNLQLKSHFTRPVNLSTTGSVEGPDRFGDGTGLDMAAPGTHPFTGGLKGFTGFHAGYMANIPSEWQSALGYSLLSGWVAPSIISRTSHGPSAGGFNAADITTSSSTHTWDPYLAYPLSHKTLGEWEAAGEFFGIATQVRGAVVFDGTDTVAFFGTHGEAFCYGVGGPYTGSDPGSGNAYLRYAPNTVIEAGDLDDNGGIDVGDFRCFDPVQTSKSNHGYPYRYSMWLYDINDFIAVKNGTTNPSTGQPWKPWDVVPYERFNIDFPVVPPTNVKQELLGASWDPATRRLFLSQYAADPGLGVYQGIVQVFEVPTP